MTYKGYCQNCGAKLAITYAKNGVMIMFCPHTPSQRVKTGIGMMQHLEIYCGNGIVSSNPQLTKSTAIHEHKKEATYASNLEALHEAFRSLTKDIITLKDLRDATKATVTDVKLLEYANIAIMLELPVSQLPNLFNASMKLGYATGISTEAAIRALSIGVGRQSRLVLDNIGIVFKAQDAYAWYKREFPDEDFDRVTAWKRYALNLIMEQANKIETEAKSKTHMERLYARLEDSRKKIGKLVLKV